jgi:asparagine synthase (glutamine-hydrolysing)
MCGVAAILKTIDVICPAGTLKRMRDEVAYRGPDDKGSVFLSRSRSGWAEVIPQESDWEVGLAHRRLSILDLTSAGHQPMAYGGRFWLVYNGEVYNFLELRTELERLGYTFRSSSDSEVILAAYSEWGPDCFRRFRGMWGLIILDCVRNQAILSRDRLGIKPLYMWREHGIIAVASEIKQFLYIPGFSRRIDIEAADEYLRTGYETAGRTLFRDVEPVKAGSWVRIPLDVLRPMEVREYWNPERVKVTVKDPDNAATLFGDKLRECVRLHLRSDVPVGCALSGGLDSSSIAVLIKTLNNGHSDSLHTFTSTFPGDAMDEREYAEAVVAKINATPHFVTPNPVAFLEDLDRFLWIHDEPVGSLQIYASYCVARLTREAGVPVTLNGQGSDELFSGYWQLYFLHLRELWKQGQLFTLAKHFTGALIGDGNPALFGQIPLMIRRYGKRRKPSIQTTLRKTPVGKTANILEEILTLDEQSRRVYEIRHMFLPRLLKWDDRNSMAFSVEGRYPFLDHELIELCLSFAPQTLYRHGWTKYPLRLALKNDLPRKILQRRSKFGFEVPQDKWVCGKLQPVLESWLGSERPVWNHVEREDIRRLAEQSWRLNGKQDEPGEALFRTFIFDRWLEIFGVQN